MAIEYFVCSILILNSYEKWQSAIGGECNTWWAARLHSGGSILMEW